MSDLTIFEVESGSKVFDWEIPDEWNIKDAYIKDETGKRVIDFNKSNLHVVNLAVITLLHRDIVRVPGLMNSNS